MKSPHARRPPRGPNDIGGVSTSGPRHRHLIAVPWTGSWTERPALVAPCVHGVPSRSFAAGLRNDLDAVTAGLTTHYSSGAVEGTVNRIKMIKRQMFGRAKFDLLRKRILDLA